MQRNIITSTCSCNMIIIVLLRWLRHEGLPVPVHSGHHICVHTVSWHISHTSWLQCTLLQALFTSNRNASWLWWINLRWNTDSCNGAKDSITNLKPSQFRQLDEVIVLSWCVPCVPSIWVICVVGERGRGWRAWSGALPQPQDVGRKQTALHTTFVCVLTPQLLHN